MGEINNWIKKTSGKCGGQHNGQIVLLVFVFVFSLKFFQSTPFERPFFKLQAVFLGIVLLFLMAYVLNILMKKNSVNRVVLYYLILITFLPFYSGLMAGAAFGQPILYGILAERSWILVGVGVWFYYVVTNEKVYIEVIRSSFIFMAWASLIVFIVVILTYDTSQLTRVGEKLRSGLVSMSAIRGVRFKFQNYFITFGTIYYFINHEIHKNVKHLVTLLLFLSYVVFVVQGRTYMLALAVTFLVYYWFNYPPSKLVIISIKLALFLLAALIAVHFLMPDYLDRMSYLFTEMFRVLTGTKSQEYSANSRILQSNIILQYFKVHPLSVWLGTGRVSHQWQGGYQSILGYFYPTDTGVLGGLFLYGIVGMIFILAIPLAISIRTLRKVPQKGDVFIMALKYLLVFEIVRAAQGSYYFGIVSYVIPLFILMAYTTLEERLHVN